jgi:hypothetical protein
MRLNWSKMTAFLGFVNKDFGELGSCLSEVSLSKFPKSVNKIARNAHFATSARIREPHQLNVDKRRPRTNERRCNIIKEAAHLCAAPVCIYT